MVHAEIQQPNLEIEGKLRTLSPGAYTNKIDAHSLGKLLKGKKFSGFAFIPGLAEQIYKQALRERAFESNEERNLNDSLEVMGSLVSINLGIFKISNDNHDGQLKISYNLADFGLTPEGEKVILFPEGRQEWDIYLDPATVRLLELPPALRNEEGKNLTYDKFIFNKNPESDKAILATLTQVGIDTRKLIFRDFRLEQRTFASLED